MTGYKRPTRLEMKGQPNADQKRFLMAELTSLNSWGSHLVKELPAFKAPRPPKEVTRYNREVARLRARHKRKNEQYKRRFADAVNLARKAIHFGTIAEALAAIDKLTKSFS